MPDTKKKRRSAVVLLWEYDDETWSWETLVPPPLRWSRDPTRTSYNTFKTLRSAKRSAFHWCKKQGYTPIMGSVFPGRERDNE